MLEIAEGDHDTMPHGVTGEASIESIPFQVISFWISVRLGIYWRDGLKNQGRLLEFDFETVLYVRIENIAQNRLI